MEFQLLPQNYDPGDETQRNFRYQHAYGVILLISIGRGSLPYSYIWCEFYEDFLCERNNGQIDVYQVKTRKPELGLWSLRDEPLRQSIKRFVDQYKVFGEKIERFVFVSNADFPKPYQYQSDPSRFANSPVVFIETIRSTNVEEELSDAFLKVFQDLLAFCECNNDTLFSVCKKVEFIKGPSREGFDAEIAHEHLASLPQCISLRPKDLNSIRDELVTKIFFASSLRIEDPDRHLVPLNSKGLASPQLYAKRIPLATLYEVIDEIKKRSKDEREPGVQTTDLIYICHATSPLVEEFSKWLYFQLTTAGYAVWCNLIDQKPGSETHKTAERIIEAQTSKFLFVVSNDVNSDPRTQSELQLAYDKMKSRGIDGFIVPIILEDLQSEIFLIRNIASVSFVDNWANGLRNLLIHFEKNNLQKTFLTGPTETAQIWRLLIDPEQGVYASPEEYLSNWFQIRILPENIYFHELKLTTGIGKLELPAKLPYPGMQHSTYLASFAEGMDFDGSLGNLVISESVCIKTKDFLEGNFPYKFIKLEQTRKIIVQLLNLGWEHFISQTSLISYQMANGKICHYYHLGLGNSMISFDGIADKKTKRSLIGYRTFSRLDGTKNKRYWHFGVTAKAMAFPEFAFVIKSHVLFSDDGNIIWQSKERLHAARRKWCKDWWNDEWRDRLLAMVSIISNNQDTFAIPFSSTQNCIIDSQPMIFCSPISYVGPKEEKIQNTLDSNEAFEDDVLDDDDFGDILDDEGEVDDE